MTLIEVQRRPEIRALTGIRAFAACWVVMFHAAYLVPSLPASLYWFIRLGFMGVDLFFVLSGFIISYNYWERFSVFSWDTYRGFLWARLARLYPVHLFTLIVSALLLAGVKLSGIATVKDFSTWTFGNLLANVAFVHAWRPYIVESWNNASWSASCEWFAYLLFPLLVLAGRRKISLLVTLLCAAMIPAIPAFLVQIAYFPPFFLLIKVMCEFIAGCFIFHVYKGCLYNKHFRRIFACGVGFAVVSAFLVLHQIRSITPDWLALIFPFVILAVAKSSGFFEQVVGSRIAVYGGRVSYSLYMTHNVTLWILKALLPVRRSGAGGPVFIVYIASIAGVAILTYHCVEEPGRAWMRSRGIRKLLSTTDAVQDKEETVHNANLK